METIKRKDGNRYRESYYLGRKKVNGPYFRRKTDANTWKTQVIAKREQHKALGIEMVAPSRVTFAEYADKWLRTYVGTRASKTLLNYRSNLITHLIPRFGRLYLSELTAEHGLSLIHDLKATHSPKGIANIWIVLKALVNQARRDKLLRDNPFDGVKVPKAQLREDGYWVKAEISQFLKANLDDPLYPLIFVAIHTGLRLGELCGLQWDRVNFDSGQITITRTRDKLGLKETTKTQRKRFVPLMPEVMSLLLSLKEINQLKSDFVFLRSDGKPIDYGHVYRDFKQAQKRAKMGKVIRFHDLRHTFASNYMMNGGAVFALKDLLGHSAIEMTMRYSHCSPEHLKGSLEFMSMTR